MRIHFPNKLPTSVARLTGMSFRNKGHLMMKILKLIFLSLGGKTNPSIIRGTFHIVLKLIEIYRKQGLKGTTLYLKTCSVLTQQCLGGHIIPDITPLGTRISRTKRGVPCILPILWRRRIFTEPRLTRYVLSIFAIYRFLLYDSPVKIGSITNPSTANQNYLKTIEGYIPQFFKSLARSTRKGLDYHKKTITRLSPILTKSPTTFPSLQKKPMWSSNNLSVARAWVWFESQPHLAITGSLMYLIEKLKTPILGVIIPAMQKVRTHRDIQGLQKLQSVAMGKLGLKQEPAGKMRVFAMVDPISQWALKPIHETVFSILRTIRADGTFNQTHPLLRSKRWDSMFSLDLSSATDRLPLSLQKAIVEFIYPQCGDH